MVRLTEIISNTHMGQMENYTEFVETMAKGKENRLFFNSGPNHAAIVMARIFKYAQKEVRIFCGGFKGTISNDDDYLKNLQSFLERDDSRLFILIEDDSYKSTSKIFKVLAKFSNKVEIYKTNTKVTNITTNEPVHFATGDSTMIRVETDVKDYTAQVNFGASEDVKLYNNIFFQIMNKPKVKVTLSDIS